VDVAAASLRLDPERALAGLVWSEVFGRVAPVEVEVGIGKGRFLLAAAAARPEVDHLGIEWANEYLRIAETRAGKRGLRNVRFVRADAKDLVARAIPQASVAAYYVFYPDPWPKKRHHQRRFFDRSTIDRVVATLVPGGRLHVATDHDGYWEVIEPLLDGTAGLRREPVFGGPAFPFPPEGALTNFEAKYEVEGRSRHRGTWRRLVPKDA
jgi:tRNA (guanine-N7-)-methyltransferase